MPEYGDLSHITGNVGQDPRRKDTSKGPVVTFTVGETLSYGEGGKTRWWDVTVWKEDLHPAVMAEVYRGAKVTVEGNARTENYNGKDQYRMSAFRVGLVTWLQKGQPKPADDDDI